MRPSSVEAFFFFVLLILVCPDGAYPLWVKPFFLLGRDFVCLVCWLRLAQPEPQPSRWRLCRLTDGTYPLRGKSLFCLPGGGQNHFFFCSAKEKAVLDSEKEKVDQWKSWGGAVQQDRNPMLLWYPSGKRL